MAVNYMNPAYQTTSTMAQSTGAAGALSPQDWQSIVQQGLTTALPLIFSLFQAQAQRPPGLATAGVMPSATGYGAAGALSPQDWTNIVSSAIQQIPWGQIFSMFQAQPARPAGLGTMGVMPSATGYGAAGALSPQDWTNIVGSVLQTTLPLVFSLFQAQPALAAR